MAVDDRAYAVALPEGSDFPRRRLIENGELYRDRGDWVSAVLVGVGAIRGFTGHDVKNFVLRTLEVLVLGAVVVMFLWGLVLALSGVGRPPGDGRRTARRRTPGGEQRVPRRRKRPPPADPAPGVPTGELGHRADTALIDLDDAVRLREHDLAAARATFAAVPGVRDHPVATLARTIDGVRSVLVDAFALRRRADDERDEPDRRVHLHTVATRCAAAGERLDGATAVVNRLYELEQNAKAALTRLRERVAVAGARLPGATATLTGLRDRWPRWPRSSTASPTRRPGSPPRGPTWTAATRRWPRAAPVRPPSHCARRRTRPTGR